MTCSTLGGCVILLMAILAISVSDIFPGTEFFIFEISVVASIALRNLVQGVITTDNLGTSVVLIMMTFSTFNSFLMCFMREHCGLFTTIVQGNRFWSVVCQTHCYAQTQAHDKC